MPTKKRSQLIREPYLRQGEIQHVFGFGYVFARMLFTNARKIDAEELGGEEWLPPHKVRTETVFRLTGLNYAKVCKDIEKADAVAGQSAESK